jgi:hypothetical protein
MLMGPEMIVDVSCLGQRPIERSGAFDRMLEEQSFGGPDEPLDTAVLPGAARLAVLNPWSEP